MRNLSLIFVFFLCFNFFAQAQEFPMGKADIPWGVRVENSDEQFKLKLGTRIQSIGKLSEKNERNADSTSFTDFYIRRMRLMLEIKYSEDWKFYADIRNDDVSKNDKGEQDFNIGDAYLEKKLSDSIKVRLLRAKVDVSRTQTVSSARILFLNRASITDHAAQYVSHNRRAANAQILGKISDFAHYQLVVGDGVYSQKFYDALGAKASSITRQNAMIGGKVRFSPIKSMQEKKLTEAYYGKGKVFSFALGAFNTSNIQYNVGSGAQKITNEVDRTLYNLELTYHNGPFTLLTEAFRFDGEVFDFSAQNQEIGSSSGYVIQGEYCFDNFYAPFIRFESWNKFEQKDDATQRGYVIGVNRYLKGEKFRYGLFYTDDYFEESLSSIDREQSLQVSLMMNY